MCRHCNKKKPITQIEDMKTNNEVQVWRNEFGKRVEKTVNEGFFNEKLKSKGWQLVEAVEPEAKKETKRKKAVEIVEKVEKEVTDEVN